MIIIYKKPGEYVQYAVNGYEITFANYLTLDLNARYGDNAVHIDICEDKDGALVIGAAAGRLYVAELDIPKATYHETMEGELVQDPLDMEKVTLSLWPLEQEEIPEEEQESEIVVDESEESAADEETGAAEEPAADEEPEEVTENGEL